MKRCDKRRLLFTGLLAAVLAADPALAQPIAYPAKGQSPQQQQRDDQECYGWAKSSTGVDPAAVAAAPPPPHQPAVGGGERAVGAVRGAVIGGIVGGSDGAAKGAGVGVVVGGSRARQNRRASQEANRQGQINSFYRAHSACMEGRGYSVK
ncbi:MAG TPA: hypothetical protein VF096_00610 [Azonexus sp.]